MKPKYLIFILITLFINNAYAYRDALTELSDPYTKVLKKFTREGAAYSAQNMDAKFIWEATYHSDEFRNAFRDQYQKLYPHGQDALADKLGHPWEGQRNVEFFIALYARARGLKRMSGEKNLWDLSLGVGSQNYKPISVEEIPITPFEYKFYPYLNSWSRAYRVIFPVVMSDITPSPLVLELNSVAGKSKLTFKK